MKLFSNFLEKKKFRGERPIAILICLSICWVAVPQSGLAGIQDETGQQETSATSGRERPNEFLTLESAIDRSRISGQPILVFVRASWCSICTAMESEFQSDEFEAIKTEWTLVSLDIDRDREEVLEFRVDAVPTVLLLDAAGKEVARQTGMVKAGDLTRWIKSGRKLAVHEPTQVLVADEAPTKTESLELIGLMGNASPEIREIAIARMASYPEKTRGRAVDALADAELASRIGLIDLLGRWQAPIDGIDPWDSASMTDVRLKALKEWSDTPVENLGKSLETVTPEQIAHATLELDRFVTDSTDATRLLPRFSRYGKHLLPAVYERLGNTDIDIQRQRLFALRYWLVASNQLRLSWSTGFVQLGAVELDTRREAVREVLNRVSSRDADLLLELFGDSDPLIRELSLRGLQKVGASQTDEALVRLLADPDLNIRAAVLKLLAEQKPERMVSHVAAYLEKETDSDLLVHGLRFFKETAKASQQLPVLIKLSNNPSWQVRAMVAEVLGEIGSEYNTAAPIKVAVADTLMKLVDDDDGFVVSRAVEHMPAPKTSAMMERLAAIIDQRPELAGKVVQVMSKSDEDYGMSNRKSISPLKYFLKFMEDERPAVRVAGINGLATSSIEKINFEKSLADPSVEVRIATAQVFIHRLDSLQDFFENASWPSGVNARHSILQPDYDPEPSILQSVFGGLFGGRPRKSRSPGIVELAIDNDGIHMHGDDNDTIDDSITGLSAETEETTGDSGSDATDFPPDTESVTLAAREERLSKLPPETAEKWLNNWVAVPDDRPDWLKESKPLLETMADSTNSAERLPALMALVVIGLEPECTDQLFELASTSADSFLAMAELFKWLPLQQRTDLLRRMLDVPKHHDLNNGVIIEYANVRSLAAAEVLWDLTDRKELNVQALFEAIQKSYFGNQHYAFYVLDSSEDVSSYLLEEITERATVRLNDSQSNSVSRQIALALLYWMNPKSAASVADGLLEDNVDQELTNVALQIRLASLSPEQLESDAAALLKRVNASGKKIVLQSLAYDRDDSLRITFDGGLQLPRNHSVFNERSSSSQPKLRVPKPPAGLQLADISPLLESEDAESRALATYYSILLDDTQPVASMIDYWNRNRNDAQLSQLVVDVVSRRGDDSLVPVLVGIYELHGGRDNTSFSSTLYWTIRSMSGPAALALRQRIRQEVGMNRLN